MMSSRECIRNTCNYFNKYIISLVLSSSDILKDILMSIRTIIIPRQRYILLGYSSHRKKIK